MKDDGMGLCLALLAGWSAGCGGGGDRDAGADLDGGPDPDGGVPFVWQTLTDDSDPDDDDLGCSLQSVWGAALDDLYLAGGTLGVEPRGACALHFDGTRWERLAIELPQSFWWTTVTPEGTAWFAGEEGRVVRFRDGTPTVLDTGVATTLFGIWGASDSDVWTVGGDVGDGEKDVLLHYDGAEWTRVKLPKLGVQLFKVWGSADDDVFVVGGRGTILHHDGASWSVMESGTTEQLFTVHGTAGDDVWAVGMSTTVLRYDGTSWTQYEDPSGEPIFAGPINGVFAPVGGDVFSVGLGGVKFFIRADGTHLEETLDGTGDDLHAVWADAEGHAVAVGGNFFSPEPPVRRGTIAFRGVEGEVPVEGLPLYTPEAN